MLTGTNLVHRSLFKCKGGNLLSIGSTTSILGFSYTGCAKKSMNQFNNTTTIGRTFSTTFCLLGPELKKQQKMDDYKYSAKEIPSQVTPTYFEKTVVVNSIEETRNLAERFSSLLESTDVILLIGDMGSGKSVFARHVIRVLEKDMDLNVPSPTFLLDNIYESKMTSKKVPIHHIDLYRLERFDRLDLPSVFSSGISLIEWGNRLLEEDVMKQPHHTLIRDAMSDTSKCHILCIIFEPVDTDMNSEVADEQDEKRIITFHSADSAWKDRLNLLSH